MYKKGTPAREAADHIHQSAINATRSFWNQYLEIDLLILSTPHGVALSHDFALYLDATAGGKADIQPEAVQGTVSVHNISLDTNLTLNLLNHLADTHAITGIQVSPDLADIDNLHWGEVIPLLLLQEMYAQKPLKHIILSQPLRRHEDGGTHMIPELLSLGHAMRQWMDDRPERIGLVVSGDLSHTHEATGPYGYSPTAEWMDKTLGYWAQDPYQREKYLLEVAADFQPTAQSCGFTGFVLLQSVLCTDEDWKGTVWVNRNATYYGMMVASFERASDASVQIGK
jgi:aromatic ring-opening dioxygenase LigB subunit